MTPPSASRPRRDDRFLLRTLTDGRRQASWRMWVLVWVVPGAFGTAALYLALEVLYKREMTGTVVRVYKWQSENAFDQTAYVYGPVFRYTWTDGTETEATAGIFSSHWNFPVGTEKTIRYRSDSKADIIVARPSEWLVARVIATIALIALIPSLIGTSVLWWWMRKGPKQQQGAWHEDRRHRLSGIELRPRHGRGT